MNLNNNNNNNKSKKNECSLNFRAPAVMINGTVDLTKQDVWDWPYKWILDVPPLTDEEKSNFPWNFPLVFIFLFFLFLFYYF